MYNRTRLTTFTVLAVGLASCFSCDPGTGEDGVAQNRVSDPDSISQLIEVSWRTAIEIADSSGVRLPELPIQIAIGTADLPLYEVVGVVPSDRGRWIIGQASAPFLLRVGATVEATLTGTGDGPGELRRLSNLVAEQKGGLVAFSAADRKLIWFDSLLSYDREVRVDGQSLLDEGIRPPRTVVAVGGNGRAIVIASAATGRRVPFGISRPEWHLVALDSMGEFDSRLAVMPGDEIFGEPGSAPETVAFSDPPLQKRTIVRVSGQKFYVLDTGSGIIDVINEIGATEERFHFASTGEEPSERQITAALEPLLNAAPEWYRQEYDAKLRRSVSPGAPPVLRDFVVQPNGNMWLWFDAATVPEAAGVVVRFDPSNGILAAYVAPVGYKPLGANNIQIWGTLRGEYDLEQVVILRLPE